MDVARTISNVLRGCFENVVDIFLALKDMISKITELADDPIKFINDQIELIRQLMAAISEDAIAFVEEVASEALEVQLFRTQPDVWIGKFGCQLAAALFTGGGSLISKFGDAARLARKINEFLTSRGSLRRLDGDSIPDGPDRTPNTRDNDQASDGEDLNGSDSDTGTTENGTDSEGNNRPAVCTIGNSFPTGTQVRMASGHLQPIQEIQAGDLVLAADPETGVWSNQLVLDQWSHPDDCLLYTSPSPRDS